MKKRLLLLSVAVLVNTFIALAVNKVASSGNWNDPATWTPVGVPVSGDHVVIPASDTVTVNCNCGVYDNMSIVVNGIMDFVGGQKIRMTSNGTLVIGGNGALTGGNGGSKFEIGPTQIYNGGDPDLLGPLNCDNGGCISALPVKLVSFEAKQVSDGVLLTWVTATETNNSHFTVESSVDGIEFVKVADVYGKGNSIFSNEYTFLDKPTYKGNIYYRLKQTDFNGNIEYFEMITVFNHVESDAPVLYPNPSKGVVNVFFHNKAQNNLKLIVSEMTGHVVYEKNYDTHPEFLNEQLDLTELKKGLYFVYIYQNDEVIYNRLMLQ